MQLVRFFGTATGQPYANEIKKGNSKVAESILKAFSQNDDDLTSIDPRDLEELNELVSGLGDDADGTKTFQPMTTEAAKEFVTKIFGKTPKQIALETGAATFSGAANALSGVFQNNGNRLAAAILEGTRQHTASQDERFGLSNRDKAGAAWANETVRRGNNKAIIAKELANTVDRLLGQYQQDDLMRRQMIYNQASPRNITAAQQDNQANAQRQMSKSQARHEHKAN